MQAIRCLERQIDSRTVEGTNKEQLSKWSEDYGEDSDFYRVARIECSAGGSYRVARKAKVEVASVLPNGWHETD